VTFQAVFSASQRFLLSFFPFSHTELLLFLTEEQLMDKAYTAKERRIAYFKK